MKETILYIVLAIFLLFVSSILNLWVNEIKTADCEKVGGTIVKNISNSRQTTCIMDKHNGK